jgi:hypothetical protein
MCFLQHSLHHVADSVLELLRGCNLGFESSRINYNYRIAIFVRGFGDERQIPSNGTNIICFNALYTERELAYRFLNSAATPGDAIVSFEP